MSFSLDPHNPCTVTTQGFPLDLPKCLPKLYAALAGRILKNDGMSSPNNGNETHKNENYPTKPQSVLGEDKISSSSFTPPYLPSLLDLQLGENGKKALLLFTNETEARVAADALHGVEGWSACQGGQERSKGGAGAGAGRGVVVPPSLMSASVAAAEGVSSSSFSTVKASSACSSSSSPAGVHDVSGSAHKSSRAGEDNTHGRSNKYGKEEKKEFKPAGWKKSTKAVDENENRIDERNTLEAEKQGSGATHAAHKEELPRKYPLRSQTPREAPQPIDMAPRENKNTHSSATLTQPNASQNKPVLPENSTLPSRKRGSATHPEATHEKAKLRKPEHTPAYAKEASETASAHPFEKSPQKQHTHAKKSPLSHPAGAPESAPSPALAKAPFPAPHRSHKDKEKEVLNNTNKEKAEHQKKAEQIKDEASTPSPMETLNNTEKEINLKKDKTKTEKPMTEKANAEVIAERLRSKKKVESVLSPMAEKAQPHAGVVAQNSNAGFLAHKNSADHVAHEKLKNFEKSLSPVPAVSSGFFSSSSASCRVRVSPLPLYVTEEVLGDRLEASEIVPLKFRIEAESVVEKKAQKQEDIKPKDEKGKTREEEEEKNMGNKPETSPVRFALLFFSNVTDARNAILGIHQKWKFKGVPCVAQLEEKTVEERDWEAALSVVGKPEHAVVVTGWTNFACTELLLFKLFSPLGALLGAHVLSLQKGMVEFRNETEATAAIAFSTTQGFFINQERLWASRLVPPE